MTATALAAMPAPRPKPRESWQSLARKKWRQREGRIPEQWRIPDALFPCQGDDFVHDFPVRSGFFTKRELIITESSASNVAGKLASGAWTAVEVTQAVCKRAAVAQQLLNCVTEICFDEALARAQQLDEHFRREGKVVGPLHGLPVSLKDQFNLRGLDSTIGYVGLSNQPADRDSGLVRLLAAAGAVVYVKSNVPTTLMMSETTNNIFGRTLNPHNRALTPGGSSGGEAALLAFGGSLLGVGTDMGGSIRHPCSFTGLYGLRPSHGRVPCGPDVRTSLAGQEAVRSVAGPMARHPADLRLFMAAVAHGKPWLQDPQVLSLPWRAAEEVLPARLCFGFALEGDGHVTPSPPLRRAMEMARARLLAAGHAVVDFVPRENREAQAILLKMWTADGGRDVCRHAALSGEPLPPHVDVWMGRAAQQAGLAPQSVSDTWENQQARSLLAQRWCDRWQATEAITGTGRPIDALLIPSAPLPGSCRPSCPSANPLRPESKANDKSLRPAPRHSAGLPWQYGSLASLLDLTSGVFPVTTVDADKDVDPADFQPQSRRDEQVRDACESPLFLPPFPFYVY